MKLIMKEEGGEAICALATGEGRTIKQNSQFGARSLSPVQYCDWNGTSAWQEWENREEGHCNLILSQGLDILKTLPKAKRIRGLSSAYQSNFLGHITSSYKFHLQNLDQGSTSKSQPNISISTIT